MQGLTEQSEHFNDLLPAVCPRLSVCLAMWPLAGLAVIQGMAQRSPTSLHPVAGVGHFCSCLGVLPLRSTQRWDQASVSSPQHMAAPPSSSSCSTVSGIQLLEQLISVSNVQAELSTFLVCELFQPCSVPAVVGGSSCQPSPARSHHRAGPCCSSELCAGTAGTAQGACGGQRHQPWRKGCWFTQGCGLLAQGFGAWAKLQCPL